MFFLFLFFFLNELGNYNLKTNFSFFGSVRISSFLWNVRFHLLQFSVSVRDWITNKIVSVLFFIFFCFRFCIIFLTVFHSVRYYRKKKVVTVFDCVRFEIEKKKKKLNTAVKFQPICINIQILI